MKEEKTNSTVEIKLEERKEDTSDSSSCDASLSDLS